MGTMRNPYLMKLPIFKYPMPRMQPSGTIANRAPNTPRRKWDGEDDKSRDPDFILGKKRSRSNSTSTKSVNRSVDNITIRQKLPCETCGGHYASRQSLQKHQRKV